MTDNTRAETPKPIPFALYDMVDSDERNKFVPVTPPDHNGVQVFHSEALRFGHYYLIVFRRKDGDEDHNYLTFQQGAVKEVGMNGLTSEALLQILIHRTECLDVEFPCKENTTAIRAMTDALNAFNERTENRMKRGVEGQSKP